MNKNNRFDSDLIKHEAGHVLTYIAMRANIVVYLASIAVPSVINYQSGLGGKHTSFYTEKMANTFSKWFFGPFNNPNLYPTY